MDINLLGTTLIAGSSDKSIKIYELTKEQIALETENERKIEEQMDEELTKDLSMPNTLTNPLNKNISGVVPIKKNLENLTLSEDLCDAIDLCEKYKDEVYQYEIAYEEYLKNTSLLKSKSKDTNIKFYNLEVPVLTTAPLMLLGKNIFDFILSKIKTITPLSELENTLNNLPYPYIQRLLFYFEYYLRNRVEVELISRCFLFILRLYETQFSNDKTILRVLESISINLRVGLEEIIDIGKYNYYSMEVLERVHVSKTEVANEWKEL